MDVIESKVAVLESIIRRKEKELEIAYIELKKWKKKVVK